MSSAAVFSSICGLLPPVVERWNCFGSASIAAASAAAGCFSRHDMISTIRTDARSRSNFDGSAAPESAAARRAASAIMPDGIVDAFQVVDGRLAGELANANDDRGTRI